jgi:protein subunit release factor B
MNIFQDLSPTLLERADKLGIFESDIQEQFVRGTGKGGQKVNKTSSTVHLKHRPTGIEVKVQKHRQQSLNRISAYKLLIKKVELLKLGKKSEIATKIHKLRKQKQKRSRRAQTKVLEQKSLRADLKQSRKNIV